MVATKPKTDRTLRWLAFLAGLAVAAILVLGWRADPGTGELGLELRVIVNSTGELGVSPAGELAVGRELRPRTDRDGVDARTAITNQTAQPVRVSVRGLPSSRDLDDLLAVTVHAGGRRLFRGPLGQLRSPTRRSLRLEPGRRAPLRVSARLPEDAASGYQARIEDLTIELRTRAG